jgi:hypothetical protein
MLRRASPLMWLDSFCCLRCTSTRR